MPPMVNVEDIGLAGTAAHKHFGFFPQPAILLLQNHSEMSGSSGIAFAHQQQAALRKGNVEKSGGRRESKSNSYLIHKQKWR
jgi:hypothetical protein